VIDEYLDDSPVDTSAIHDVGRIEGLVRDAARGGRALSYSELLGQLGFRFTRPKMRQVCRTLDEVDRRAAAAGEPELAVLVVRESDGLPGQGWWTGRTDYAGLWTGPEARAHIDAIQAKAFAYWKTR
jgi:shikimate 5-dehydrogenase